MTYQTAAGIHKIKFPVMNISEKTSNAIKQVESQLGEVAFHNYKYGVLSVRVKSRFSQVEGFKVVSCNPNDEGFILKVKI